eukprot:TRINITY_DN389_c1_g9_i1.p1 TRINITY_DN389_c1_g9~~TRINITY_DN389_c1_g9_i1.p1  ORF type:complete len:171 (-),score=75.63 TRINITY_DN389_c1_g9_i1:126-638(-)
MSTVTAPAPASGGPPPGVQAVDLTKLSLMQLTQFNNQMEQDLQFYMESLQNLKLAQTKFQNSGDCVSKLSKDSDNKEILVPLTGSMYVPGRMADLEKVLVDVGTGYYVEKDTGAAKEYFDKKVKYVTDKIEKVQMIGNEKNKVKEAVMEVMQGKIHAELAQQQQQAAPSK